MVLTRVRGQVAGDVVFDLDLLAGWKEVETAHHAAEGGNSHAFTVVELTPPLNG